MVGLQKAAEAAIKEFNSTSTEQLPLTFLRIYPTTETVNIRMDANNETHAEMLCARWANRIRKHYAGDFAMTISVKGKVGLYAKNFHS